MTSLITKALISKALTKKALTTKALTNKMLLLTSLVAFAIPSYASDYLCSYTTRISDSDKYNSSGALLAKNYSNTAVASILRQDRANFYVYNKEDREDEADCLFDTKGTRAKMEKSLASGSIPQYTKKIIVDRHPLLYVDVYDDHINVKIIQSDYSPARSTIR